MSVPTGREEIINIAAPAETDPVATIADPLYKVTDPEGAVVPLACLTLTTRVKGEFCVMLVDDGAIVVTVLIMLGDEAFTVIETIFELDALKVTAPE